jgi:iron complex transport system ATP-binding protein
VEEIMPMFTHALILRRGQTYASGQIDGVLTSANLSAAFDAMMKLRINRGRYALRVNGNAPRRTRKVM